MVFFFSLVVFFFSPRGVVFFPWMVFFFSLDWCVVFPLQGVFPPAPGCRGAGVPGAGVLGVPGAKGAKCGGVPGVPGCQVKPKRLYISQANKIVIST